MLSIKRNPGAVGFPPLRPQEEGPGIEVDPPPEDVLWRGRVDLRRAAGCDSVPPRGPRGRPGPGLDDPGGDRALESRDPRLRDRRRGPGAGGALGAGVLAGWRALDGPAGSGR